MNRNVEIKARIRGEDHLRHILSRFGQNKAEILHQRDTFFHVPRGRLKLRETSSHSELIFYDRPDQCEPTVSEYLTLAIEGVDTHRMLLEASLGIRGVISKRRLVYILDQTRIHIDDVENLGSFIELEVVLTPDQSIEHGQRVAKRLMELLDIKSGDLIPSAYIDLIDTAPLNSSR